MLTFIVRIFSKRLIYTLSNKFRQDRPEDDPKEKLTVDFKKPGKSPFDIKTETSYNSYLSNGSLVLELKKTNCIAWVEIPDPEFKDQIINAKIRLDSLGGYASTGVVFRLEDQESYYLALVSSKGYFRLDVVKDSSPKALIAWTEISEFDGINIDLNINTCGNYLYFLVNGKWAGEINDDSIRAGKIGFALASYETENKSGNTDTETVVNECTCRALLDYFTVDAQIKTIEEKYSYWTCESNINAEGRLRLAETFAVMGKSSKALEQIRKAWKRRDEAVRDISVYFSEVRTKKELLLAARMSQNLAQYNEADEYINLILEQWPDTPEGKTAYTEKIKILNELNKFGELKEFVIKYSDVLEKNIDYYTMLGRCYFELKEYEASAGAWKKAFGINNENGVYAVNAASALELSGEKSEAAVLYLEAGKLFLKEDNQAELAAMMPKLSALEPKNWETRSLAGKWAFSIEDYDRCVVEFTAAEKFRRALKPRPKADPAVFYLWGLILKVRGNDKDAVSMIEKAVKLAPDYELFRMKLTELKQSGVKR
jgi:tetratricopeptide (TPR) repeat protein